MPAHFCAGCGRDFETREDLATHALECPELEGNR